MNIFWQRACEYAAPSILLVVFGTQVYQVRANALNPWRGGGFAMFSTVDAPTNRVLRCYLLVGGKQGVLPIPRGLAPSDAEARILPTADRLTSLGTQLLVDVRRSYKIDPGRPIAVRVEVWSMSFDPTKNEARLSKLREATVEG